MLLLFLYFAFLGFCRSATFDDAGPHAIMELIDSDFNSAESVQIVNETLLVEVLVQNGTSAGYGANDTKLPDLDRREYVEIDEDTKCGVDHNFVSLGTQLLFNSRGSRCAGRARLVTCRVWSPPEYLVNHEAAYIETSTLWCAQGHVCRQDGARKTRFGDEKPRTDCVLAGEISTWVITTRQLGEKCSPKFRFAQAGGGSGVKFHLWAWNMSTGVFAQLKWMYLKINGVYVKSAAQISDWTVYYYSIKSTDTLELCGTAWGNDFNLELQSQGTVF